MRRRLVSAFMLVVVAVILMYGIPRAFVLAGNVREASADLVARGADAVAAVVAQAQADDEPIDPRVVARLLRNGERVEVRGPDGRVTVMVPRGVALGEDDVVAVRDLPDGTTITYSLSADEVVANAVSTIAPLVLLGLALIPLGGLAGALLARHLARPFSELATAARAMGHGDLEIEMPPYAVPEADEIATALQESARQLDLMLQRERDVAVNASHELRTPITALRLALEDVALWPQATPEVAAEMERLVRETDRLAEAVTTLLDARRRWSSPVQNGQAGGVTR